MQKIYKKFGLFILGLTSMMMLASCGGDSEGTAQCSQYTKTVAGGKTCVANESSAVVALEMGFADGTGGGCSGSLIASNRVLTAAHCLVGAKSVTVYYRDNAGQLQPITASKWVYHPQYQVNSPTADGDYLVNDVGIVTLSSEAPITTIPVMASSAPQVGQQAIVMGWGGNDGGSILSGILRYGVVTIKEVTAQAIRSDRGGDTSASICSGDSGGPLISSANKAVIGVASYGLASGCSGAALSFHMNISNATMMNFIRAQAPNASFR